MVQHHTNRVDHQVRFGEYEPPTPRYKGTQTLSTYLTMRDGVKLAVDVVLPKNLPPGEKIPALLQQTRYWRSIELRTPFKWFLKPEHLNPRFKDFKPFFTSHGYALVNVDVRGTGASFGTWPYPWDSDSIMDAREIVDWIIAQPWSNGKVGGHGVSYLGTTAELLPVLNHPAVKVTLPMFNHPDAYSDIAFPGGIFNDRFVKSWGDLDYLLDNNTVPPSIGGLKGRIVVKGVKPVDIENGRELLQEAILAHADNGIVFELSQDVDFRDKPTNTIDSSVEELTVHQFKEEIEESGVITCGWGSWMDSGTADAVIRRFLTYNTNQRAIIGAWEHGGQFHASPYQPPDAPVNPSLPKQWLEMLRFFDAYLKDIDNGIGDEKVLYYYTMGEEKWKKTNVWPPEGTSTQRWYLGKGNTLTTEQPVEESGSDTYKVDFEASTGELNRWWELSGLMQQTVQYENRAEAARHMLTYTSPPLDEDIEITGYPIVTLYITSTQTDGAFYVYLEDVDENGYVTYIAEGQLRAIHRKVSNETPPYTLQVPYHTFKEKDAMPLVPGEVAELTFGLLPTSVLIRKGHRMRIGIAGHDEGTFVRIPEQETPVITIARNKDHTSFIDLPIIRER